MTSHPLARIGDIKAKGRYSLAGGPFGSKLGRKDYQRTGVPVIRGANLPQDRKFSMSGFVFVSPEKADELKANLALPGDVVVTQRGTLGQVGLIPIAAPYSRFVVSQSQMKVSVDSSKANNHYVYYAIKSPAVQGQIAGSALTAGVPHINLGIFEDLRIPCPQLAVQEKIASVLTVYDELIETNRRRIEILEEMAQALYREWFVSFRFPGWEESQAEDLPPEWKPATLGDLADTLTDGDWIETKDQGGSDYRLLQVSNVGVGSYRDTGNFRYITAETFARLKCTEVKVGQILISRMPDPIGRAWMVEHLDEPAITSVDVAIFQPPDSATGLYVSMWLNQPSTLRQADTLATGTTRKRISRSVLARMELLLPPHEVLELFAAQIMPLKAMVSRLRRQNDKLFAARDLLLPKLIGGEIDVSDLDIDTSWLAA